MGWADVLGGVLLVALALKARSIYLDNQWVEQHGIEFAEFARQVRERIQAGGGQVADQAHQPGERRQRRAVERQRDRYIMNKLFEYYEKSEGDYPLFGVKAYRATRLISGLRDHKATWVFGVILGLAHAFLFRYLFLSWFTTPLFALTLHHACSRPIIVSVLAVAIALNLLMIWQLAASYSTLGRYFNYFHFFRFSRLHRALEQPRLLPEMKGLLLILLALTTVGAAMCFVVYVEFDGLKGDALIRHPGHGTPGTPEFIKNHAFIFFQMVYFTVVTLGTVGYGDIVPSNLQGQLAALLIQVQGFLVLMVVLNLLINELKANQGTNPPGQRGEPSLPMADSTQRAQ